MTDHDRTDHADVDPERTRTGPADDADSYSGQVYTRDKEDAIGRALPSGSVMRPEGGTRAPPSDGSDPGGEQDPAAG